MFTYSFERVYKMLNFFNTLTAIFWHGILKMKRGDSMAQYTAAEVAKWFLSHASMTHKKIQKLCYYAQAWYCALYDGKPLFDDEIQAWVHGPVVPSLYPIYADYKWTAVPMAEFDIPLFDTRARIILEAVYETYGDLSGDQLESLTHSEDPWIQARGNLKPWETSTTPITCAAMRKYYFEKYEQSQND